MTDLQRSPTRINSHTTGLGNGTVPIVCVVKFQIKSWKRHSHLTYCEMENLVAEVRFEPTAYRLLVLPVYLCTVLPHLQNTLDKATSLVRNQVKAMEPQLLFQTEPVVPS